MGKPKSKSENQSELLGKKIKYIGLLGANFECAYCKRKFKTGMVSEYGDRLFCNDDCIKISLKTNESS